MRQYAKIPFEIFIAVFSIAPFFILACFYSALPDRVPLFIKLNGEVDLWGQKTLLSVFRLPLMAIVTQLVCLLMKYGTIQSAPAGVTNEADKPQAIYLKANSDLWDWLRWTVAFKMSTESLDTIFLSLEPYKFLSRPAFIITAIAALLGVAGALFYGFRLMQMWPSMKQLFRGRSIDQQHVYGGVLYFNRSDSALFAGKYLFNFGNKWAWVFIASIIAYPLLVFLPG